MAYICLGIQNESLNKTDMTALEFSYSISNLTKSLKPVAYRLTRDNEDAEDLVQETVFKAFSNR
jgi:RNA polymerase sigma-70 factor (ECF subfamily)